jgi:hypothetical protein
MRNKIVRFNNGKFGIRRWSLIGFGYEYLDLSNGFWLPSGTDCQGTLNQCFSAMDKGKLVSKADLKTLIKPSQNQTKL